MAPGTLFQTHLGFQLGETDYVRKFAIYLIFHLANWLGKN